MMDPVTGIGLAAAVIQLVTFSNDAVKKCRQLYQHGSLTEHNNLGYTAGHLASLTKSLQQSLQSSGTQSLALSSEEKELVDLGRNCEETAHRLQHQLRKLQTQPAASALESVRKAARAIWKRSNIRKIQEELETYQLMLETSLLYRLSQRFEAQGLRSEENFASLDRNLQHVVTCLANSQTSLATLVVQQSERTRHNLTTQIDRVERLHTDNRLYEDVTKSLFYPGIFSREEQVDNEFDGIEDSYHWIFNEPQTPRSGSFDRRSPQQLVTPWGNFAHWLRSGHGVYWINGKAGSGKSTLMNYICNHDRRLELLQEWCPTRRLLTPTFFFWNAGTYQNKSINGLLRSLIYQMLTECHELIECFENEPLHAWNERRLTYTLLNLLRQTQIPVAICVFIDGLDEFDGRHDTVVQMIKDLANQTHVKICLSSRPLLAFEEAFNGKPSLRLQDLTFGSIRAYADFQLSGLIQQCVSSDKYDRHRAEELLTRIVKRADGVFLWAVIAIRKVRDGLRDIVDMNELAQDIEILPSQLEGLYMLMLNRIGPVHQRFAAQFLQITLYYIDEVEGVEQDAMDLCRLHLIHSQREVEDAPFSYEKVATSELVEACRTLRTRLLSHTAGLLELTPTDKGSRIYSKRKNHDPVLFTQINFLHRTARDFLLNNDEAKSFLAHKGSTEAQVRLSIARGTFAQLAQFSQEDVIISDDHYFHPVFFAFYAALQQVSMVERLVGAAQSKLMRSLDYKSFVREDTVTEGWRSGRPKAFMMAGYSGTSIDLVGMAAAVGMTIYVCEQLGLSVESRSYSPSLPNLKDYSRNRATAAILSWNGLNDTRDPDTGVAIRLRSSSYRQSLGECLQWKVDSRLNLRTNAQSDRNPLAETYLLSCCTSTSLDLARILLRAGANPMVHVESSKGKSWRRPESFWESWLGFMQKLRYDYMIAHRRSGGLVLHDIDVDLHITLDDIFDTTKALLAHGADINYQMGGANSGGILNAYMCYLKRPDLEHERFDFELTASAMFTLEECFNKEPEFQRFADAMKPLVQTPTRKIICIGAQERSEETLKQTYYPVRLSAEKSELLWLLVEKWESTGHRSDLNALQSAMERVWRAHSPGIKSSESRAPILAPIRALNVARSTELSHSSHGALDEDYRIGTRWTKIATMIVIACSLNIARALSRL